MDSHDFDAPARWPRWLAGAGAVALALALILPAVADARRDKSTAKYYFLVWKVTLADGVSGQITDPVRAGLRKQIDAHPRLVGQLPDDAPDPNANPEAFERYAKKRKIRAYRVNVEVTKYELAVEPMPDGKRGNLVTASVALRTFGETVPRPQMAFAGSGSATVKMQVGKRVRPRDREIANDEAIGSGIEEALEESLLRLDTTKPKKTRKKRRKK